MRQVIGLIGAGLLALGGFLGLSGGGKSASVPKQATTVTKYLVEEKAPKPNELYFKLVGPNEAQLTQVSGENCNPRCFTLQDLCFPQPCRKIEISAGLNLAGGDGSPECPPNCKFEAPQQCPPSCATGLPDECPPACTYKLLGPGE